MNKRVTSWTLSIQDSGLTSPGEPLPMWTQTASFHMYGHFRSQEGEVKQCHFQTFRTGTVDSLGYDRFVINNSFLWPFPETQSLMKSHSCIMISLLLWTLINIMSGRLDYVPLKLRNGWPSFCCCKESERQGRGRGEWGESLFSSVN